MAKSLSDWLTYMMAGSRPNHTVTTTTKDIDPMYTAVAPFALGSADTEKNILRHRKDIYTKWQIIDNTKSTIPNCYCCVKNVKKMIYYFMK